MKKPLQFRYAKTKGDFQKLQLRRKIFTIQNWEYMNSVIGLKKVQIKFSRSAMVNTSLANNKLSFTTRRKNNDDDFCIEIEPRFQHFL